MKNPSTCTTEEEFLDAARFSAKTAPKKLEFNFPSAIIMLCQMSLDRIDEHEDSTAAVHRLTNVLRLNMESAEEGMLQLAFLNQHSLNPGSSFIVVAVLHGWRYRADKGFHRI